MVQPLLFSYSALPCLFVCLFIWQNIATSHKIQTYEVYEQLLGFQPMTESFKHWTAVPLSWCNSSREPEYFRRGHSMEYDVMFVEPSHSHMDCEKLQGSYTITPLKSVVTLLYYSLDGKCLTSLTTSEFSVHDITARNTHLSGGI